MKRITLLGILAAVAGCSPSSTPADSPRAITPLALEPPPIYALLGYRQDLSLESTQIAALDSIAYWVRDRNAPLADSVRGVGDMRGRGYALLDAATGPLLDRIRENNRRAVEGVERVLTPEQRSTTCRLFREARTRRSTGRGSARQPPDGRGAERRDSIATGMAGLGWSWCSPAPEGGGLLG